MSHACCGEPGEQVARRDTAPPKPADRLARATDGLAFAASPTFAAMALLNVVMGADPASMICAAAGASPLTGMAAMYLLMSAFHAGPWLKLIRERLPAS